MKMNLYKVTTNFMGYGLTAVVACKGITDSVDLAGFEGDDYSEQESTWIGDSIYTTPQVVCKESL